MPRFWFTADTHFGHANIMKFCQRPFLNDEEQRQREDDPRGDWKVSRESLERHDQSLIEAINRLVSVDDTLWVLGDFCWGKHREAKQYVDRIRCERVNLVWGNHDHRTIGQAFNKTIDQGMIRVQDQRIWLNHYPMRSWDGRFHGSWHLYGHVHGRLAAEDEQNSRSLTRDVGVDVCNYAPISFEELQTYMAPREDAFQLAKQAFLSGDESCSVD